MPDLIQKIEKLRKQLEIDLAFLPEAERKAAIEEKIRFASTEKRPFSPLSLPELPKDYAQKSEDYL